MPVNVAAPDLKPHVIPGLGGAFRLDLLWRHDPKLIAAAVVYEVDVSGVGRDECFDTIDDRERCFTRPVC